MRRVLVPIAAVLCLSAFSSGARKEGLRVTVTAVGTDTVGIDVTGSLIVSSLGSARAAKYTADHPYHIVTPAELMPLDLTGAPLVMRAPQGKSINVVVERVGMFRRVAAGSGRIVEVTRKDTTVHLVAKP